MEVEVGVGLGAAALIIGWPLLLLVLIYALERLEAWMLQPDERAAAVQRLLDESHQPDEVERAVTALMAEVADRPYSRRSQSQA